MGAGDNKRSIVVGIFIFLGIAIFVVGVLVLGGQQKRFSRSIRVNAVFDDVAGLKVGNNVWFSGVKIGTVKRMHFYGNSQVEVTMNIETDAQQYIRKDAMATVSSEGFIGNKIVDIFGGTTRAEPIAEGDRIRTQPALSTDKMLETLQENNQNLLKVTNDFKELVGKIKQGKGTVGAVLTDEALASNLRSTMTNLQQASQNSVKVSGSPSQFASKLNQKGGLANELVTDTSVYRRLRASATQLQQATSSAAEAAKTATQVTNNLERATQKLDNPNSPLGVLLTDEETSRNLKTTMRNLSSGTQKLDENLEALQHNFLLRGFFRRREKEQAKQREKTQTQAAIQSAGDTTTGSK